MPAPLDTRTTHAPGESAGAARGVNFVDAKTLMQIKNLQMRAKVIVEGFYAGIHRSPYHGISVEFSEYRQYVPGDDVRYVDWRLFARSDRYYVKRFEDETNVLCYLLVDTSRSMGFGAGDVTKHEYARTLAATMAYFLYLQRDAVGLAVFDEHILEYLLPRRRTGHLRRLMAALQREPQGTGTDLARPLEQIAKTVRKRGMVILISDLLAPVEVLATQLGYLRSRGHEVLVLRVLDPSESTFPFTNPRVFHDMESGKKSYIDPQEARKSYLDAFKEHATGLTKACNDLGVEFVDCPTDRPLELSLFDLLRARMLRSRTPSHNDRKARRGA
ncbi:hypothetical protein Pla175_26770 [Pirellulimonas nuda]|uniref:DUF58 domain-containing protein n=1 Tax=Pirellulimonas nuda TaxID=2528009 RepID=A0A518DCT0_9BACT|nr:DUF58 domain-containing protein [Pirellulimonas nuda]QDU89288.1 hypothetical protein Pla175_26770 [Pirellulimonas nuda]